MKKITDDTLITILTSLALGQIEAEEAARVLSMGLEDLVNLLDDRPELMAAAEDEAARMRSDPDFAVSRGIEGLNAVVAALAARVRNQADQLAVSELSQAGNLLERLVGIAEQRKAQAKAERTQTEERLPLYIQDQRPNSKTHEPRFVIWLIPPEHPAWIDASLSEYQSPRFDWLQTFAPLSPETGEPLTTQVQELLQGARCIDADGRILGGD